MSQSIEQELNEVRSLVAQLSVNAPKGATKALEARLAALEARMSESRDPGEVAREKILHALATADKGKPGYLSHAQIEEKFKLTKSASHHHVNELEKAGKVWIRKTHDPKSNRPCFFVYHPAAVRA